MLRNISCFCLTILAIFSTLSLSGCVGSPIDELYSLPELSTSYSQLQDLVNNKINDGSEFVSPITGTYRQSIQFYDVDSDGLDEAFVFFRNSNQSLSICVYTCTDNDYVLVDSIKGEGSSIWHIDFADLTGDGNFELLVTWQISPVLRILNSYSFQDEKSENLITRNCTDFQIADMTEDGISDIVLFHLDPSRGSGGVAELICFSQLDSPDIYTTNLSKGLSSVDRIKTGELTDGGFAMFIEGLYQSSKPDIEERFITDIVTFTQDEFKNISLDPQTGISKTVRKASDNAYIGDFNNDKIMEVPETISLYNQSGQYFALDWYNFSSTGDKIFIMSTYHSGEGWYLTLPSHWRENLTVRRDETMSGERGVILSFKGPEPDEINDFLVIYTLTGDNRHDRAQLPERFMLWDDGDKIFVGEILMDKDTWDGALSEEEIISRFKMIRPEWITGAL